jgi:hypothetical protein
MSEDEPKSAIELAMEKLRARGDFVETPLTDAQKAEIAETRSFYRARIAELEIQEESKMRQATSLEELEAMKEALAKEKERLNQEMEEKVRRIRGTKSTEK